MGTFLRHASFRCVSIVILHIFVINAPDATHHLIGTLQAYYFEAKFPEWIVSFILQCTSATLISRWKYTRWMRIALMFFWNILFLHSLNRYKQCWVQGTNIIIHRRPKYSLKKPVILIQTSLRNRALPAGTLYN